MAKFHTCFPYFKAFKLFNMNIQIISDILLKNKLPTFNNIQNPFIKRIILSINCFLKNKNTSSNIP